MLLAGAASAQTTLTDTQTQSLEVLAVDGNNVIFRGQDGTREMTVTEDFRFNVGGKQVSVKELKPGMKGTTTITTKTTTTPVTVTEEGSAAPAATATGAPAEEEAKPPRR